MLEITVALAGLGLFLSGLNFLSVSIKAFTSQNFYNFIATLTNNIFTKSITGVLIGLLTQSTAAASFMIIGLVKSNVLSYSNSLTALAWTSVGTSLLVFLVAIDIQLLGYLLLSLIGIIHLFNLKNNESFVRKAPFIFAIGLIFFGLGLIKSGTENFQDSFWVNEFFEFASETILISMLLGLFFTLITQSTSTISILVITLALGSVIPIQSGAFMIVGSNIGSGLAMILFNIDIKGEEKKAIFFQFITKCIGSIILFILLLTFPELLLGLNPESISTEMLALKLSLLYLYLQLSGALFSTLFNVKINTYLSKLLPDDEIEGIHKPNFIYKEASNDPILSYNLITKEQERLLQYLPDYMDYLRPKGLGNVSISDKHGQHLLLLNSIKIFSDEVIENSQGKGVNQLLIIESRNDSLKSILVSLDQFVLIADKKELKQSKLCSSMIESLHMILTLLKEHQFDEDNLTTIRSLTSDRGSLMETIRNRLAEDQNISNHEQKDLFILTRIFERIIWQVGKHTTI